VFEFSKPLAVEDVIDALEESDDIRIDYAKDGMSCKVTFADLHLAVTIQGGDLTINLGHGSSPRNLLQALSDTRRLLAGTPECVDLVTGSPPRTH
jgi:hypothetical protein